VSSNWRNNSYPFGWLVGYSALLGPIAGIMIVDYFVVRRRALVVDDLYLRGRGYEYSGGFNYRALFALAGGIAVAPSGLAIPAVRWLYDYAWFAGFLAAGALHLALMRGTNLNEQTPSY